MGINLKLDISRKELLDLGLPNPLVNFRVRTKRMGVAPKLTCYAARSRGNGTTFFGVKTETRYVSDSNSQACSNRLL